MRSLACDVLNQVLFKQRSLTPLLNKAQTQLKNPKDKAQLAALCYETCRHYYQLKTLANLLLKRPIKTKQQIIICLLYLGLYQLIHTLTPAYAIVAETLKTAETLKFIDAKPLLNAVLHHFIRNKTELLAQADQVEESHYNHPAWLIDQIKKAWPNHWKAILKANNQAPPLFIRVNAHKTTTENYSKLLDQQSIKHHRTSLPQCLHIINPVNVAQLPHFYEGYCSVQDISGQWITELLELKSAQRVLDACAAPGSKTCHLLEYCLEKNISLSQLIAVEKDDDRVALIHDNITRLDLQHLPIQVIHADATHLPSSSTQLKFDRILLDAPCSATGVIRRHPDIKLLRRPTDIKELVKSQSVLLEALWPLLNDGGLLVYTTCSILPDENENLIKAFLQKYPQSQLKTVSCPLPGIPLTVGYQLLPTIDGSDGFFYAIIQKKMFNF